MTNKVLIKNTKGQFSGLPRKNARCQLQVNGALQAKYLGTDTGGNRRFEVVVPSQEG